MKTLKWSLPIVPLMTLCGAAYAQNSVTLYGLIDEGVNFTNNGGSGSSVQLRSGNTSGSRWGFRGTEDLGNGLAAIFRLEGGFNASNGEFGENGRLFGRQAYVGLQSDRFGTLTLGRQYDPTVDLFSSITAAGNWAGDIGAVPFDNDNADWDFRVNNSVKYATPNYRGLSGEALYGFSNTAGGFQDNRVISVAGQYLVGGLTAEAAYMSIDHPGSGTAGAVTDDAVFSGSSQENIDAGVAYKFKKVQVAATYSHTKIDDPTNNAFLSGDQNPANGGTWTGWRFDNFQLNGEYFFKPDFWFAASYTYTLGKLSSTEGDFSPRWHIVTLMLDYDFSPRTSVYVQGAYQHVESAHTGTEFDDAQSLLAPGASSSPNQLVYRVAMIHRF